MSLLFLEEFNEQLIRLMVPKQHEADMALDELKQFQIIIQTDDRNFRVKQDFASKLAEILSSGFAQVCNLKASSKAAKRVESPEMIYRKTNEQWRKIIRFIIDLDDGVPSNEVMTLLINAQLASSHNYEIDNLPQKFKFLLSSREDQVIYLLENYLKNTADKEATFTFFYNLSTAEPGKAYSKKRGVSQKVLSDLVAIGLIYQRSSRYYVSPFMIGLLTNNQRQRPAGDRFMIIETNFRVYAYTESDLSIVLLSYFLKLEYRLTNLVIGSITRSSVDQAFKRGLSSDQILEFLNSHSRFPVPSNIMDQIKLWESEKQRLFTEKSILLEDFVDNRIFKTILLYAKQTGAHLFDDEERNVIVLKAEKANPVISYLHQLSGA